LIITRFEGLYSDVMRDPYENLSSESKAGDLPQEELIKCQYNGRRISASRNYVTARRKGKVESARGK
jgi:hypothetical protein